MSTLDQHAADELKLYIDNDGDLYRQQTTPILKNLATKMVKGIYSHEGAVKLFGYLAESGAKKYVREFNGPSGPEWSRVFSTATRRKVAEELVDDFEAEWKCGSYRSLLPKKYQ